MSKKNLQAFSMIELLLAIAIAGMILLFAVPSYQSIINKNRAEVYLNELATELQFARFAAVKLNDSVRFCGSSNNKSCDGSWQKGQLVVSKSGKIIRIFNPVFLGKKLIWRGGLNENYLEFLPTGFLNGQQGSFYYCPKDSSERVYSVVLSATGRVRTASKIIKNDRTLCNF